LQLRPGEELQCNGCHANGTGNSHGRPEAFASVYTGATTTGQPFPNTDPAIFADVGETMAEARARMTCATDCNSIIPSVDVRYTDVWTDVAGGGVAEPGFTYLYADLTTGAPVSAACQTTWAPACRTVINYEATIHPLWSAPRMVAAQDVTCTLCHNRTDAMGQLQVPAAQLELTNGFSGQRVDFFLSYEELMFGDNELELNMGALQDRQVQNGVDPVTGLPILVTVPVAAPASAGGAGASNRFFAPFAPGGTHAGRLTPAELRLMSEWLDIGAQYYNNPFDAPLN
jgi:hypothetical protein